MSRLRRFIVEIHHRSLWQVLLIYCGGAWICYEIIDTITDRLALPEWLPVLAIILFLIGLPVVLATAFVHEDTVPAYRRAKPTVSEAEARDLEAEAAAARRHAARRHRFLNLRNAGLAFVGAMALWGVVATGWLVVHDSADNGQDGQKSVAVLPFANMSADPENEYFSDGITDDIITHLTKVADLRVTSRTSVMQYKDTEKNIRQIAEELGVATILEGGVRRVGDRVRINAQLVDADSDKHLWAETYDRDLADVFAIQSDVAEQIAAALRATLTLAEKERIHRRPTENLEAYDYYLRGNDYFNRGFAAHDLQIATEMYDKAVELDPYFAPALARLAQAHEEIYWHGFDRSEERLGNAGRALRAALQLDPDLAEAHLAAGYSYYRQRDYERALAELEVVEDLQPGNAEAYYIMGLTLRRAGAWEEAVRRLRRAVQLDPLSARNAHITGSTYLYMRLYQEAGDHLDLAIDVQPDWSQPRMYKAWLYLSWEGSALKAKAAFDAAVEAIAPAPLVTILDDMQPWYLLRCLSADHAEAIGDLALGAFGVDTASYYLTMAELHGLAQQTELSRAYFDSARVMMEDRTATRPDDARSRSILGVAYAGLGQEDEAIGEAQRARALLPVSKDALWGRTFEENLAWVYVKVGDHDAALDQLEYILSIPSEISVPFLRIDPLWDPLRDHPRFQALLEEYE